MALFQGEDLIDVATVDGRTLKLPRSIVPASLMPQQVAQTPGFTDETAYNVNPEVPSVTGGALPSAEPAPLAPVPAQPDIPVGVVDQAATEKQDIALQKQAKQTAAKQAARAGTDAGRMEAAQTKVDQAAAEQHDAILGQADVDYATTKVLADAVGERNKNLVAMDQKLLADHQKTMDEADTRQRANEALGKKIAGTKIDRQADHPIIAAIAASLAGLGAAMNGQKIDTLDILYRAIDRKVAAQEADLDKMGKVYGMGKEEVAALRDKAKNKLEFRNVMMAAELEKAARGFEEITARSANEAVRTKAAAATAELKAAAASRYMEATRWGLDYDQKERHQKQQIGLGYAGLKEQRYATDLNAQIHREDIAADLAKALAADRAKGDEAAFKARLEADKEVRQTGIKGVDNDYLLTPEGRAKMEQANQLEEQAAALESDPDKMKVSIASDKIAAMKQKAAILRGDARSFGVVKARSDTQAGEMSKRYAAVQSMVDGIDEIKMLSDKAGRGYVFSTPEQQEIQTKFQSLKLQLKEVTGSGAWDKGLDILYQGILGGDPSSGWTAGVPALFGGKLGTVKDPEGFKKRLDAVALDSMRGVEQTLAKNSSWDGKGELFTRKSAPKVGESATKLSKERSADELTKDAESVGAVGKFARKVGYPFSPSHAEEAELAQSDKYIGLSKEQEAPLEERLKAYKAGDKRAGEELIATVAEAAQTRPAFAIPLLQNLRQHAPQLYAAARSAVPKDSDVDKQMSYEENNRIGTAATPTAAIAAAVLSSVDRDGKVTDEEGYRELARRAGQKDKSAQKAIMDILKQSGANRSLPAGSVFRGGR